MEPVTAPQPHRNQSGISGVTLPDVSKGDTVVFSVRMPRELHRRLVEVSQEDDSTVNRTLIVAARRYIRQWEGRHPQQPKDAQDAR